MYLNNHNMLSQINNNNFLYCYFLGPSQPPTQSRNAGQTRWTNWCDSARNFLGINSTPPPDRDSHFGIGDQNDQNVTPILRTGEIV